MSPPTGNATGARVAHALIPVKCFHRAKSRLSEILSDEAREAFARSLFSHVLTVAGECAALSGILVATDCEAVAAVARARGARVIFDGDSDGDGGAAGPDGATLSSIVDRALAALEAEGATAAIVLMSDLPQLERADLELLLARLTTADLVLAPDLAGEGTNALALAPPTRMPTCFGHRDSCRRHRDRAERAGLRLELLRRPSLELDVDGPADYARLSSPHRPTPG